MSKTRMLIIILKLKFKTHVNYINELINGDLK